MYEYSSTLVESERWHDATPHSMDHLFEQLFGYGLPARRTAPPTYALPIDILETDDAYVLHATVAGVPHDGVE